MCKYLCISSRFVVIDMQYFSNERGDNDDSNDILNVIIEPPYLSSKYIFAMLTSSMWIKATAFWL